MARPRVDVPPPRGASARARDWYRFSGDFDARPCTLPKLHVDDLSADAFERTFRDAERPVVIVGLGPTRSQTLERVSREGLLDAFGDEVVTLSSSNTFSYEKKRRRCERTWRKTSRPSGEKMRARRGIGSAITRMNTGTRERVSRAL